MITKRDPSEIEMVKAVKRLNELLTQEVALLEKMKLGELNKLQEEKEELTKILEQYKNALVKNPEVIETLDQKTLNEMKEASSEFENILEKEKKQIERARGVHTIVMDKIKEAVANQMASRAGYNNEGYIQEDKKKLLNVPSISVSESC